MNKVWHLSTCNTCQRIIKELDGLPGSEHQNLKEQNISPKDLDWLREQAGSYEALFNRRSMKFREWGLKDKNLTEEDYRRLILEEYTFLKRPVIVAGKEVFIGNAKKVVGAAKAKISG